MYHTTGFTRDQVVELCAQVHAANEVAAEPEKVTWPPILGLFKSVVVTLTHLRRNRVQAEIGEAFSVSQSTISPAITAITPLLDKALQLFVPTADELHDKAHITWSTERCCRAGHGLPARNCTPANTRQPV